jgi:hypothetical protein
MGKRGRPTKRTEAVEKKIIDGLRAGTPLTVICRGEDMPHDNTVRDWINADPDFSVAIARAREAGFDQIALDALRIADATENDTIETEHGEKPNSEWITRSRLRVETRLKLLAKWDPRRYGEMVKVGNADGSNIKTDLSEEAKYARFAAMAARAQGEASEPADNAG